MEGKQAEEKEEMREEGMETRLRRSWQNGINQSEMIIVHNADEGTSQTSNDKLKITLQKNK